ncbi:hypothetical protein BC941DRAFT_425105 [Chlamydoabsidia padenii]|nr:hypothetical protein BC941DRAFT_425105 [Chlamydoabsidia padenii]
MIKTSSFLDPFRSGQFLPSLIPDSINMGTRCPSSVIMTYNSIFSFLSVPLLQGSSIRFCC